MKAIKDALNRIAWADDAQVADMRVSKVWGSRASTLVRVESIKEQGAETGFGPLDEISRMVPTCPGK